MYTYKLLESSVKLAHSILQREAQSAVSLILGDDALHDLLRLVDVLLVAEPSLSLEDAHTNDLIAIIDEFSKKPLQCIIGVGILIDTDHEGSRSTPGLVALVSHIEGQRGHVVLGGLAYRQVVESDMLLKPVVDIHG